MDRLANKITELEAENLQWKSLFRSSSIPEERVAILNLITANTNAITQLHASKSASLQGSNLPSPRLAELLYVVVTFDANNFPVPLGSAFVAESKSMTLLITADHVATGSSGTRLFVVRKMTRLTDGSLCMEPSAPIEVVLLARDATSDVAVLRCTSHVFPKSIKLCPRGEEPSIENEDRVKSYHCPIQLFVDCYMDTIACVGTDYSKLRMSSSHHYWLAGEHVHGSSGGVVVDTNGRAVGMIVSGHVVGNSGGPRLETGVIEIDSRWEKISALSDGTGPYT